jgi:hypothetical protein
MAEPQDDETRVKMLQLILTKLASLHHSIEKWMLAEGYLPVGMVRGWTPADRDSAMGMVLRELNLMARAREFSDMTMEEVGNLGECGTLFYALLPAVRDLRPSLRLLVEYRLEFDLDTWARIRWGDWDDGIELDDKRLIGLGALAFNLRDEARRRSRDPKPGGDDRLYDRDEHRVDPADWWKPTGDGDPS